MEQLKQGIKRILPLCISVIPVGISFGVIGVQGGLTIGQTILMSALVCAGASQIMAVGMLASGASLVGIVLAVFLINLRHLIMSAYVMNRLKDTSIGKKMIIAAGLCDESFASFSTTVPQKNDANLILGMEIPLYCCWVGSTALGCFSLQVLPDIVADSFSIAFYAAFIGMLVPSLKGQVSLTLVVLFTIGCNCVLRLMISSTAAVILSILCGALAGAYFLPRWEQRKTNSLPVNNRDGKENDQQEV